MEAVNRNISFKKELLVEELLSLGNSKITPQIAGLVGTEVENEIHRRRLQFLSTELINEMVAAKLQELGLIAMKPEGERQKPEQERGLFPEILEVMASSPSAPGPVAIPLRPRRIPLALPGFKILEETCCVHDEAGVLIETADKCLRRVSRAVSEVDAKYNPMADLEELDIAFYNLLADGSFLPEIFILKNAGRALGMVLADYVLPLEDTTESIFETMKKTAAIRKLGGTVGISFSALRPKNDTVHSNAGGSLGPVAFIKVFGEVLETVFHGHGEWGGLAVLNVGHPDIFEFVEGLHSSFRLCVGLTESFIKAVCENDTFPLINPRTGEAARHVSARVLLEQIARGVKKGELSFLFLDAIQAANPTPKEGNMEAAGAGLGQPLLPYESLAAGHVNLARMVSGGEVDWEKLSGTVRRAVHFLDNVLEINTPPFPETATAQNRKIGLGVIGFGAVSEDMEKIMAFIQKEAERESLALAQQRGFFPRFHDSIFENGLKRRHASLTFLSEAPDICRIAGVEPAVLDLKRIASFQKQVEMTVWQTVLLPSGTPFQDICLQILEAARLGLKVIRFKMEKKGFVFQVPAAKPEPKPVSEPSKGFYFHPED